MSTPATTTEVPPPARAFGALLLWMGGLSLLVALLLDARLVGVLSGGVL